MGRRPGAGGEGAARLPGGATGLSWGGGGGDDSAVSHPGGPRLMGDMQMSPEHHGKGPFIFPGGLLPLLSGGHPQEGGAGRVRTLWAEDGVWGPRAGGLGRAGRLKQPGGPAWPGGAGVGSSAALGVRPPPSGCARVREGPSASVSSVRARRPPSAPVGRRDVLSDLSAGLSLPPVRPGSSASVPSRRCPQVLSGSAWFSEVLPTGRRGAGRRGWRRGGPRAPRAWEQLRGAGQA